MRILFLAARYWPEIGGVEKHVASVAEELVGRGHEVRVVTQRTRDEFPLRQRHPRGGDVVRLRDARIWRVPLTATLRRPLVRAALAREISAFAPDLVHVHDATLWSRWWAPLRSRFPKLPAFITFHGWEGRCPPAPQAVRERQKAARTAVGSMAVGGFIEKWYGTKADVVIYGAADAVRLKRNDDDWAPLARVLFLGRLARDTGIATFLEAWLRFADKNATARLTVIGDGPLRDVLQRRARETAAAETVRWLGALPPEDVFPHLVAHGLVFAGGYLAILDALAAGARVGALYDNPLRRDYLECFPYADRFLRIAGDQEQTEAVLREETGATDGRLQTRRDAAAWAKTQTWAGVADHYETLWRKTK